MASDKFSRSLQNGWVIAPGAARAPLMTMRARGPEVFIVVSTIREATAVTARAIKLLRKLTTTSRARPHRTSRSNVLALFILPRRVLAHPFANICLVLGRSD